MVSLIQSTPTDPFSENGNIKDKAGFEWSRGGTVPVIYDEGIKCLKMDTPLTSQGLSTSNRSVIKKNSTHYYMVKFKNTHNYHKTLYLPLITGRWDYLGTIKNNSSGLCQYSSSNSWGYSGQNISYDKW